MKRILVMGLIGTCFGYTLHRVGFGSFRELERMFLLQSPRLPLMLGMAIALLIPFYLLIRGKLGPVQQRITWRTIVGAALFGTGWALSGACPSIVMVQLGTGYVPGLAVLLGILSGVLLHRQVQHRWLPDESASCSD